MKFIKNDKMFQVVESIGMPEMNDAIKDHDKDIPTYTDVPLTMAAQYKDSEKLKANYKKVMDDKEKEAKSVIPKSSGTGKQPKNMYTKISLDESLFEDETTSLPDATEQQKGFREWKPEYAPVYIGKKLAKETEDEGNDLFTTIHVDLESDPDSSNGRPGPRGGYHSTPSDDETQSHAIGEFDGGLTVSGADAASLENAKRIASKYADFGVYYEMVDYKGRGTGYFHKQLKIYIPTMDDYTESLTESAKVNEVKPVSEAKVINDIDLETYESTEQGQRTLDAIKEAGKVDQFEQLLDEMYPNGINESTLDDLLSFESDWISEMLGLTKEA